MLQQLATHTPPAKKIDVPMLLKMLVRISAPIIVFQLVVLISCHSAQLVQDMDHDGVEMFAGKHEITQAQWRAGKTGYPIELDFDPDTMDILTHTGAPHVV